MKITLIALLATVFGRSIRRPTFQMYSATGRHLTITDRVGSTRKPNSPTSTVKMVNVGDNKFLFQGVLSGLYLTKNGRSKKVRTTSNIEKATKFSEELGKDYFNVYKLAETDCALSVRKSGSVRITCKKTHSKSTAFLPRKVHTRNFHRGKNL